MRAFLDTSFISMRDRFGVSTHSSQKSQRSPMVKLCILSLHEACGEPGCGDCLLTARITSHEPGDLTYCSPLPLSARSRRCSRVYSRSSDTPNSSRSTPQITSIEASTRAILLAGTMSP
jgi:hypothetical protein